MYHYSNSISIYARSHRLFPFSTGMRMKYSILATKILKLSTDKFSFQNSIYLELYSSRKNVYVHHTQALDLLTQNLNIF